MKHAIEKIYCACFSRAETTFQEKLWLVIAMFFIFSGITTMIIAVA